MTWWKLYTEINIDTGEYKVPWARYEYIGRTVENDKKDVEQGFGGEN